MMEHTEATSPGTDADGGAHEITADLALNVVAGNAERATVAVGEPREVTPDV